MRRFTNIDNVFCLHQELNLSQAYVYEWMLNLSKWASTIILEHKVFYFASKTKAVEDLPIVTKKTNTMHVHYKSLESKGLIIIKKIDGKDYVHLTEKSKTWNLSNHFEKNQSEFEKNQNNPLKKIKHIVNTNNKVNTKKESLTQVFNSDLFDGDETQNLDYKVLDYLNKKKPSKIDFQFSEKNKKFVRNRVKDKFKLNDFKKVIDFKISEWKDDKKMKQYIRPETLFGSKFESYLIQAQDFVSENDGSNNFELEETSKSDLL